MGWTQGAIRLFVAALLMTTLSDNTIPEWIRTTNKVVAMVMIIATIVSTIASTPKVSKED